VLLKKALIITYYWPPSGGGGVQRWLKFVKYLRNFGWEPIIYTPENPDFELQDESLLADVPDNTKVLKRPIWEPYNSYRKLLGQKAVQKQGIVAAGSSSFIGRLSVWIRGNYFIPDSRVFWVRPSVSFLSKYLKRDKVDVVITTGPPHSLHLIGLELKKRHDIKWVADFRDPWSQWDVLDQLKLNRKSRENHKKLEGTVLAHADQIITVSPTLARSLTELGASNVVVITNGFDTEVETPRADISTKFRIAHIGLLNMGRNPEVLWQVLNELCEEDETFSQDLEIYLAGTIEETVLDFIKDFEYLQEKLVYAGYRSHHEIMEDYSRSAVLLLLVNNTSNGRWILPGKMYEYLGQRKPILSFGIPESDASDILIQAGHNPCIDYADKESVKALIKDYYNSFKSDSLNISSANIDKFSRKQLTKQLAACLDKLE